MKVSREEEKKIEQFVSKIYISEDKVKYTINEKNVYGSHFVKANQGTFEIYYKEVLEKFSNSIIETLNLLTEDNSVVEEINVKLMKSLDWNKILKIEHIEDVKVLTKHVQESIKSYQTPTHKNQKMVLTSIKNQTPNYNSYKENESLLSFIELDVDYYHLRKEIEEKIKLFIEKESPEIENFEATIYFLDNSNISIYINNIKDWNIYTTLNENTKIFKQNIFIPVDLNFITTGEVSKKMEDSFKNEVIGYYEEYSTILSKNKENLKFEKISKEKSRINFNKMFLSMVEKVCVEIVKKNGIKLKNISKQTEDICLEAMKQNREAKQFINKINKDKKKKNNIRK